MDIKDEGKHVNEDLHQNLNQGELSNSYSSYHCFPCIVDNLS